MKNLLFLLCIILSLNTNSAFAKVNMQLINETQDFTLLVHVMRPRDNSNNVYLEKQKKYEKYAQHAVKTIKKRVTRTAVLNSARKAKIILKIEIDNKCVTTQAYLVSTHKSKRLQKLEVMCGSFSNEIDEKTKLKYITKQVKRISKFVSELKKETVTSTPYKSLMDIHIEKAMTPHKNYINNYGYSYSTYFKQLYFDYFNFIPVYNTIEYQKLVKKGVVKQVPRITHLPKSTIYDLYWRLYQSKHSTEEFLPAIEALLAINKDNLYLGKSHLLEKAIANGSSLPALVALLNYVPDIDAILPFENVFSALNFSLITSIVKNPINFETFDLLLKNGANINRLDATNRSPIHWAAKVSPQLGNFTTIDHLLQKGADINSTPSNHISPMAEILVANALANTPFDGDFLVDEMVKRGAKVNPDREESSPLLMALSDTVKDLKAAKRLIELGASLNFESNVDSIEFKDESAIQVLDSQAQTTYPLQLSIENKYDDITMLMIERGADINRLDSFKRSPIEVAINSKNKNAASLLIDRGVKLPTKFSDGSIPLIAAYKAQMHSVFNMLLEDGNIDINSTNNRGNSLIHLALAHQDTNLVEQLIARNVDLKVIDFKGKTLLHYAYPNANLDISDNGFDLIGKLIKAGVDPKTKDYSGLTAGESYQQARQNYLADKRAAQIKASISTDSDQAGKSSSGQLIGRWVNNNISKTWLFRQGHGEFIQENAINGNPGTITINFKWSLSSNGRTLNYTQTKISLIGSAGHDKTQRLNKSLDEPIKVNSTYIEMGGYKYHKQ